MNVLLFLWATGSMKSQSSGLLGLLYGLVFVAVLLFWGRATNFVCSCKAWPPSSLDRIPDMSKKTSFKNCSITPVFISFSSHYSPLVPRSCFCSLLTVSCVSAKDSGTCKGENPWHLSLCVWLALLTMISLVASRIVYSETKLHCVCVCVCHTFFIPLLTATSADSVKCPLGLGLKQTSIFILQYW